MATLMAPLRSWSAMAAKASCQSLRREGVGEHPGEVDAAVLHEVEVVLDAVLADALDLLDAEGVGADPADLLEVERAPLPPAGRVHAALHERAAGLEHPHLHLEGLRLADGVVGDVDAAGVAHRDAGQALHGRPEHPARPLRQLLDHLLLGAEPEHPVGAELASPGRACASKRATTPISTSG